jgi:hypothetical protein
VTCQGVSDRLLEHWHQVAAGLMTIARLVGSISQRFELHCTYGPIESLVERHVAIGRPAAAKYFKTVGVYSFNIDRKNRGHGGAGVVDSEGPPQIAKHRYSPVKLFGYEETIPGRVGRG